MIGRTIASFTESARPVLSGLYQSQRPANCLPSHEAARSCSWHPRWGPLYRCRCRHMAYRNIPCISSCYLPAGCSHPCSSRFGIQTLPLGLNTSSMRLLAQTLLQAAMQLQAQLSVAWVLPSQVHEVVFHDKACNYLGQKLSIRLVHATNPSQPSRPTFWRHPGFLGRMPKPVGPWQALCPAVPESFPPLIRFASRIMMQSLPAALLTTFLNVLSERAQRARL